MPLFLSEEELRLYSNDGAAVAERADVFIRDLIHQRDTVRAEADAAAIAAEQTAALLEQRYTALSADVSRLQSENAQLSSSAEQRLSELADAQAKKHQLHLKAIGKDGEMERLSLEAAELHKSKRQILELLEQKDTEIQEKNAIIQSYLDKIVNLTDNATSKEARLHELDAELARCNSLCNRVAQEKELLEKHNAWLNEELSAKVNSLVELRRKCMDIEAELSAKLAEVERQLDESSNSLKRSQARAKELELRVTSLEKDLCSSREAASATEARFSTELATATKLADLYKASSEEWSRKAGELEGVIKALEAHLGQVESDYNEKLDKAMSVRQDLEKEVASLREKLGKCEAEIEKARKANELSLVPISDFHAGSTLEEVLTGETCCHDSCDSSHALVPKVPIGVSATALAASLLREGWSLAKMYEKYQESADALRHEKWGRRHSEAILERVLHEIEEKAEIILDERAEHERMVEAYTLLNQKLQQSLLEHDNYQNIIKKLKSELKRHERDYNYAQKEIDDLQKQATVLLKECQDIQLRCGTATRIHGDNAPTSLANIGDGIDAETIISEKLLTFKDINGLVEQNAKLRRLVLSLSSEEENRVAELREGFQIELQKVTEDAASKVEAVLNRSEEQGRMIESLHCSVAMYKRLYEEERKTHLSSASNSESIPEDGRKDLMLIFDSSQEISKKAHAHLSEHARNLERDLEVMRNELMSLRSEHEKLKLDEKFACERLNGFRKEYELQRQEANAVSARNIELSNMIVDYQKRLRVNSDSLQASEENLSKLTMEVYILKHEKEILVNSEKRASDEVHNLSERVHRLQSALDTIQSTDEVRESARTTERRKLEEHLKRTEREWAEAKKELQEERDHVRNLTLDREKVIENSLRQVEEMRKELADAWHAVASAESRAAVAEARCSDMELNINRLEMKVMHKEVGHDHMVLSTSMVAEESWKEKEVDKLKEEAHANKDYMLQYKEIAHTNEVALKQIEVAHEQYKVEAEKLKKALENELSFLKNRIYELERNYALKSEEAASALEAKEQAIASSSLEISGLRIELAEKITKLNEMETTLSSLKEDLDKEHSRWRTAQDNYERQVILQSETIQELTSTSKRLSLIESENAKLRQLSEMRRTEIVVLKSSWEEERSHLQELRNEAERKYNETNEHNKVLLNQLESLHIRLADKERSSAGFSSQSDDSQANSDLQNVLRYLRRSKEIAETEISLLKQEKLRLQSQLENALKASESAQALLHSQCENSKAVMLKDEEFKSLQLQVREISLLRESNMQIREENKHNFEECQKLREEALRVKLETENIAKHLREKQIEYDVCLKEIEMLKMENEHLNKRNAELLESCKHIDVEEYEQMKNEFQQNKVLLNDKEAEINETRTKLSEVQDHNLKLEQDLAKYQSDALQRETHLRNEHKKQFTSYKKRSETLAKENQELTNENRAFAKQIEESKSSTGRRTVNDIQSEQATIEKEKDARLQILEKTLERERSKRQKNETQMISVLQNNKQNKEKIEEELTKHKQAIAALLESRSGSRRSSSKVVSASQIPPTVLLEEWVIAYFQSVASNEEIANSVQNDGGGTQSTPAEVSTTDTPASTLVSGRKVSTQQMRTSTPHAKAMEDKHKGFTVPKPSEVRKGLLRKLVRPSLDRSEEVTAEIEMLVTEGTTVTEGKCSTSHEPEHPVDASLQNPSSGRKRLAPSSSSNIREETAASDDANDDVAPQLKKSKGTDYMQDVYDGYSIPSSSDNPEAVQQSILQSTENFDVHQPIVDMEADHAPVLSNEGIVDMGKDEQDNITAKGDTEDHHQVLKSSTNVDEVQDDSDQNAEDISDRLRGVVESLDESPKSIDECPKSDDGKEMLQSKVEEDEEREEGELMPDDSEQQQDGASGECQHDSIAGDESGMGDETGDTVEVSSPAALDEKAENNDQGVTEEGEDSDTYNRNNDLGPLVMVQSSQTSPITQEGSSSIVTDGMVSGKQSHSPATGKEELRGGRTISINASAKQNSVLRLNRGLGRGGLRDGARAPRGRRAGRG